MKIDSVMIHNFRSIADISVSIHDYGGRINYTQIYPYRGLQIRPVIGANEYSRILCILNFEVKKDGPDNWLNMKEAASVLPFREFRYES